VFSTAGGTAMIRLIDRVETVSLLESVGMRLNDWNAIVLTVDEDGTKSMCVQSPKLAQELFVFAAKACSWLPSGSWKLLNFDNSMSLSTLEATILGNLLFGGNRVWHPAEIYVTTAILFEFDGTERENQAVEIKLIYAAFQLLMFERFVQVVSSSSPHDRYLSFQDDLTCMTVLKEADNDLETFASQLENEPYRYPDWINELLAWGQEELT
jgi:hypothetical protein